MNSSDTWEANSHSGNFEHFMKPEGLTSCSQEFGLFSEPDQPAHLHMGLPNGLFPSCFSTEILYVFVFYTMHACYMLCLFYDNVMIQLCLASSTSFEALHCTHNSSLLLFPSHPYSVQIFFWTRSSQTPSICVLPVMWQTRSTSKNPIGKIIILYNLIFRFVGSRHEDKMFCAEWWQTLPEFSLLFPCQLNFDCSVPLQIIRTWPFLHRIC
jgi:hypothetical protein